jgi:hypothetical protein
MTSIFRRPTKCFGCLASTVCKKIWISIHNEFRGPESLFSCSNGQEIRFHLSHLKVYRSPSLDPIPRQLNPVHNFASYFFLIINVRGNYYPTWYYPPIYVESAECSLPFFFFQLNLYVHFLSPRACCMSRPSDPPFYCLNGIWWWVKIDSGKDIQLRIK